MGHMIEPFTASILLRDSYLLAAILVAWLAGLIAGRIWGRALLQRDVPRYIADAIRARRAKEDKEADS